MAIPFSPSWYKKPRAPRRNTFAPSWAFRGGPLKAPSAPSIAATPAQSSAGGIGGIARQAADARDPQYFNDIAKMEQYYTSRKADLTASGEIAKRSYDRSLSELAEAQPKDTLAAKVGSNKAGLFYSGFLQKGLGEIESSYAKRRTQLAEDLRSDDEARARQGGELESLYGSSGLNRQSILLEAGDRARARDAEFGVPDPTPTAAVGAAPGGVKPYRSVIRGDTFGHLYPDGRWVPIRKATHRR